MTLALLAVILTPLLLLVSFVQLLFLESLRLRTREYASLEYFKETLQDRLGYETERGAFVFSIIKHSLLVFMGAALAVAAVAAAPTLVAAGEGFALAWLCMVAATYIVPHILYRRSSGHWVAPLVPLVLFIALLFKPITLVLGFLESLYELSEPMRTEEDEPHPAEDIEALISAGEEEGLLEKDDRRLIQQVVAFGDKSVREVMTPRPSIVAIPVDRSIEELRALARNEQYSRIPVYEDTIDHIIGFIHVRDLWEMEDRDRELKSVRDLMRPIQGVPETKPVADLLREMQSHGTHIVYVVDEYGNVAGLATFEDIVEEVFGEIRDEHEPAHDIHRSEDGSVTVSGSFDLDHLYELFDYRPGTDVESTTVGGLVTEWLGAVPKAGAVVEHDGLAIEVLAADDLRVKRVRIRRVPEPEIESD